MNLKDKEKDVFIILNTGKCSWGKCLFCGWGRLEFPKKNSEELLKEFSEKLEKILKKEGKIKRIKLYCSGSFLDENQVDPKFIEKLFFYLKDKPIEEILLEIKINDISEEKLKKLEELGNITNKKIWFSIGLEVANNDLLKLLSKNYFDLELFKKNAKLAKKHNIKLRIYCLVNVPFDKDVIKTTKETYDFVKEFGDEIVFINSYPHKDAPIFWLWYKKKWNPINKKQFIKILSKSLKIDENLIEKAINENKQILKEIPIEFDYSNYHFLPKFPEELIKEYKEKYLKGAKIENLENRVFEMWEEYLLNFYEVPKDKDILFFIPCAAKKPYFLSKTHKLLKRIVGGFQIYKKMHWVVISNPGIIPYEFITKFPFKDYDWREWEETEEIKRKYLEKTRERIINYLKKHHHNYKIIISFFKPDSLTYRALKESIKQLNLENKFFEGIDFELYNKIKEETKKPLFDERILMNFKENLKKIQRKYS